MELFIYVLLVAFAVSYVTEVIGVFLQRLPFINALKYVLIPSLAAVSLWLLDSRGIKLVLSTLAVSFISTAIQTGLKALSKPKVISTRSNRYY